VPPVSRFKHRRDYREEEAKAKEQEELAKKQAIENANKAREAATQAAKAHDQESINANNKGVALGQQHRWLEAISAHEQAVQLDPRNKQFRINLSAARCAYGEEKLQQGDLNAAATLFRKALAAAADNGLAGKLLVQTMRKQGRDPNNVDTRLDIADQLASMGDLESAAVEYQAAMQLEPSARTFVKMGDIALRYGQYSTAVNWYRQAIGKDPNYGPAHRQLGFIALSQRDYTSAASSLRRAVVLDPKDAQAGETLVEIWRKQVAQNPLLAENHLGLAGALQLTGRFADAEAEYRKLEALDPKNPGLESGRASLAKAIQHAEAEKYKAAAETLWNQGLHREALAQIGRAVQMEPRNSKYQFLFAECLEANGDYQGAHQAYLTCVLLDPEHNQEAAARMREMQHSLGGRINFSAQAQQVANQYASPAPTNGAQPVAPISQFGKAIAAPVRPIGQAATAQLPASAAMSVAGANQAARTADGALQDALAHLTDLEAQRKFDEAIDLLRQIVSRNLQNAEMHHRLAVDLLANGSIADAVSEFRMACALRPDKGDYAADLARALAIHKRSQESGDSAAVASKAEVAK
jgi:tetratricopeptide (TPR) repeat protein